MTLWKAILSSFRDVFEPRILVFFFFSPLISLSFWGLIFFLFAWDWVTFLSGWMGESSFFLWVTQWVGVSDISYLPKILAVASIVLLFLPLTYFSTIILISLFGMPIIVNVIRDKYYAPILKVQTSGLGSIWNTIFHSLIFLILFTLTLPLWLLPGLQIFLPILLTAAYNRRIFSYDALANFLYHKEIKQFQKTHKSDLLLLGIFVAALAYVPLGSFFMPVIGAIAYTHFCLGNVKTTKPDGLGR
jgi:hypothetical protein